MKRNLLLAALAATSVGSAFAQSSVTVYGRLNTSIESQKNLYVLNADGSESQIGVAGVGTGQQILGTRAVLANNGSRLGFKGVEDLGGGLKAGFTLEHRFDSDTGASTNGTQFWGGAGESSVNLSGPFGMIKAGLYTSEAYFATSDVTDMLNHGTGTSSDALYKAIGPNGNKVSYRTPDLGGATAELGVHLGEGVDNRAYDFAANYAIGGFGAGFGYEKIKDGDSQFGLRGSYIVDAFAVTGYVQRYKNEALGESKTILRVSGAYNIGAAELHAAVGASGELAKNGVVSEYKARQYTLGANYNLSKRTKVYAYYNRINFTGEGAPENPSAIALGIRHNF